MDIAIFIGTAFDAEVRRQYENDLLATYHTSLVRHGVEGYSWDDFIRDFRLGLLALLATQVSNDHSSDDLGIEVSRFLRHAQA